MHDRTRSLPALASLALLAAPALAEPPRADLAELRARGPAALESLLAQYDHAAPAERPALAATIDAVAGQRYATTSRLYWYTDLERAKQAAQQLHRPILALRMLGDLRNDLSCANSRLFRTTLYANQEVAAFLRKSFVLYWSSERPIPTVTIDFGDGRKLVRTTTGNAAHYVLDGRGHVLDVLPGVYAPAVFRDELAKSLALARRVRDLPDRERVRATVAYHRAALGATDRAWKRAQGTRYLGGRPYLLEAGDASAALARAQLATVSKAAIEVPDLRVIGLVGPGEVPDDAVAWSAIGQRLWGITDRLPAGTKPTGPYQDVPGAMILDAPSRELIYQLHNAGPAEQRATPPELDMVVARLEQHIVADTALNELRLRRAIHQRIADRAETELAALNDWIYAEVFATPKSDRWLGLRPRTVFTGLPGDGVVMP